MTPSGGVILEASHAQAHPALAIDLEDLDPNNIPFRKFVADSLDPFFGDLGNMYEPVLARKDRHKRSEIHQSCNPPLVDSADFDIGVNQLDATFNRLSKQYQEDIEYRTKLIGTIIEPLIIVIIGLVVGVIMVAMYLPMFNLSNVIK